MITDTEATNEVQRMAQLESYPRWDDAARAELITAAQSARSLDSLATVVEGIMRNSTQCPRPSELRQLLNPPAAWRPSAAKRCAVCNGTGWEIIWMLHTFESGRSNYVRKEKLTEAQANALWPKLEPQKQMIYSGAKRCTCPVQVADWAQKAAGDKS